MAIRAAFLNAHPLCVICLAKGRVAPATELDHIIALMHGGTEQDNYQALCRAIQLKHWKRPQAIYRELKALGAKDNVARQVAANSRRWWRNSDRLLKTVLTIAYFDGLGVPRLS